MKRENVTTKQINRQCRLVGATYRLYIWDANLEPEIQIQLRKSKIYNDFLR